MCPCGLAEGSGSPAEEMTTDLEIKKPPSNLTVYGCCVSLSKSLHLSELSILFQGAVILLLLLQSAALGSAQEIDKGSDFPNIFSAVQKTFVYCYPIFFQMEKLRPREEKWFAPRSYSQFTMVSARSGL